jgi:hypothetical protein
MKTMKVKKRNTIIHPLTGLALVAHGLCNFQNAGKQGPQLLFTQPLHDRECRHPAEGAELCRVRLPELLRP